MKRISCLIFAFVLSAGVLLAQDKSAKSDSTTQAVKNENCKMNCCCKKECKEGKSDIKKTCDQSQCKKDETKK